MPYKDPKEIISRRQRDKNVRELMGAFPLDKHNFNTILLAMTDWIQLQFYSYLDTVTITESDKKALNGRITQTINEIKKVCATHAESNPEYMVALATVMQEAIIQAMQTQIENQIPVVEAIKKKTK